MRHTENRWKFLAFFVVILAALPDCGRAADPQLSLPERFRLQHQGGIRLGGWANLGQTPPATDSSGLSFYETDIKGGAFYLEAYFGYRLSGVFLSEISGGVVNRGDVTIRELGDSYVGNLTIYPVHLRFKMYPLNRSASRFQPYLMAGGGLYHARNDIQFVSSDGFFSIVDEDSQTDVNFVLGVGMDWPIARTIGLDFQAAYMPIDFSRDLIGIREYDALTITAGIKYLFPLE